MGHTRITVDTGGTFSDFVYLDEDSGTVSIAKLPSTPDDPARAILAGVNVLLDKGVSPQDIRFFCHGTTVGTNALLEGKGVKTGLLVTEGFRGIYEVQEQSRPYGGAIFDIMYDKPAMLASPRRTGEAGERVSFEGEVLVPLNEGRLRETIRRIVREGAESIAVCFLFSFLAPEHERRAKEIIAEEAPQCGVSLSSDVVPEIREYYRLSTTVINAYLQPILARYIDSLDQSLTRAGIATRQKFIMQSNGGMSTFAATAEKAVATVLSGPAGGIVASLRDAKRIGCGDVVTFDMGGTSCDVALIKNGAPTISNRGKIDGRDVALPMLEINTVSAGGGTLARVDPLGALQVGPQSAGAVPGPACYSRGGTKPTITDCNLVLGYLGESNFLGGDMRLDRAAARRAIDSEIAGPLGIEVEAAALGIVRIINVKMQEAIKAVSTMRGHDLRNFMLLAFGGAGPLHAGAIARDLGMAGVIVPARPGVYSAMGLLMSDVAHDFVHSRLTPIAKTTERAVSAVFDDLARRAVAVLKSERFRRDEIDLRCALDMRYAGQGYELSVPCELSFEPGALRALRETFDAMHQESFGHSAPDEPVEIVSWRARGIGRVPPVRLPKPERTGAPLSAALTETRGAWFDGGLLECPVYQRERLDVGAAFSGPAIVDQLDCTSVVFPGQTAEVDEFGNIIIKNGAA